MSDAQMLATEDGLPIGERGTVYSPRGGDLREFYLYLPEGARSVDAEWPLIIALHGKNQTPLEFASQTRFSDPAVNPEFIVAYPSGLGFQWSGDPDAPIRAQRDDTRLIRDLIEKLCNNYRIDKERVFITGFSNGAGLAAVAACDAQLSQYICGVGVASLSVFLDESMKEPTFSRFEATRFPIPMIEFHGDADPVIDYNGVDTTDGPSWPLGPWLREFTLMNEAGLHGNELREEADEESLYNGRVERFAWRCGSESEIVVHYIIRGFGHGWPTIRPLANEKDRHGPAPFDATPIILDFFRSCAKLQRRPAVTSS